MFSFSLGKFSPIRSFPAYPGPYPVGSADVELPAAQLNGQGATCPDEIITTVAFRVFYPCEPNERQRPVRWIPNPQTRYGAAYGRFLGANERLSGFLSYFPQFLYMTRIPVHRNATLLQPPTASHKWPVLIFSHGLAGSRNAYSQICGSLASHGLIVIAPDHRDGSAPISFIRATSTTPAREVPYTRYSHTPSPEVYQARDNQLRIRLWELCLIYDALLKIDGGTSLENLDPNDGERKGLHTEVLGRFAGKMDVQSPGKIVWAGHSFGATTVTQFVKHMYYGTPTLCTSDATEGESCIEGLVPQVSLVTPARDSALVQQVTISSVVLLLDMWCLPLRSKATRWLWDQSMPCYHGPIGGSALAMVLSQKFFEWEGNLNDQKKILSPPEHSQHADESGQQYPYFFYPDTAAHLSQSDFGVLFPLVLGRFLKIKEPERLLRLNCRAMVQVLRQNGFDIANPSDADWSDKLDGFEDGINTSQGSGHFSQVSVSSLSSSRVVSSLDGSCVDDDGKREPAEDRSQDLAILDMGGSKVRGWNVIRLGGMTEKTAEDAEPGTQRGEEDVGVMEELQSVASRE